MVAGLPWLAVEGTIVDAVGGPAALRALAAAWHERCLADPVVAHAFHGGVAHDHVDRLAAYWCEQLGGPPGVRSSQTAVVRMHSGNGPHEQMDGRAVAAFVLALDDVGIPADRELRATLVAWFTWATALLNHRWAEPAEVPDDLPLPRWGWQGTDGW